MLGVADTITVIQVSVAATIISTYAFLHALQEQQASHISDGQMILLAQFVTENDPTFLSLQALAEAPDDALKDNKLDIYWLNLRFSDFLKNGKLPTLALAPKTSLLEHLGLLLFAPVVAIWLVVDEFTQAKKYKSYRIRHTEIRKNYFSKAAMSVLPSVLFTALAATLALPRYPKVARLIIFVCGTAISCAIATMILYIWHQKLWKDFWQERLSDIMAKAAVEKNHDLFNRALLLRNYTELQPDIPIPASLTFYGSVLALSQAAILWLAKFVCL